jgi:formylmethanofuran dehydrogenase subunit E
VHLPRIYVPPVETSEEEMKRIPLPTISVNERKSSLKEVELTLSPEQAIYEAKRCMRCDLEFIHEQNKAARLELIESEDIYHG